MPIKVLIIGDMHIPSRAREISREVRREAEKERWDVVLSPGDLTDEATLEYLRGLGNKSYVVRGNCDHIPFPEKEIIELEGLRVCLIHGDQAYPRGDTEQLVGIAKENGADVLVYGHTHRQETKMARGVLLVNPGSATGAWSGDGSNGRPSAVIAEIDRREATITEIPNGKMKKFAL